MEEPPVERLAEPAGPGGIAGGTRIWGPWPGPGGNQVWHADLAPRETRGVTLQVLDAPDTSTLLSLESPRDYQVFQRRTRRDGAVAVRGRPSAVASGYFDS